jgi:MFS transporter, FHS family, glucose/mannose:H+ symporter
MSSAVYHRAALTWAAYSGMFVFGIALALLAPILPYLFEEMQLDPSQAGGLFVFLNGGSLVVALASGPAFDRFGFKILLIFSSVLCATALAGVATASSYMVLAGFVFLLGLGGGGLNSGTNAFVADLHPGTQAAALSRLGVFFGVGAVFIPLFIGAMLSFLDLKIILMMTAGIALIPAIAFLSLGFPPGKHSSTGFPVNQAVRALSSPLVLLIGILLFFQSGNEMNSNAWMGSFLVERVGLSAAKAPFYLAGFWGGVLIGRLFSPLLLRRVRETTLVQASAVAAVFWLVVLVAFPHVAFSAVAAAMAGLSISPIFPCVLGYVAARFPGLSGTVFGVLMSIALIGGMVLPLLAGYIVGRSGAGGGLLTAAVGFVAVFVLQTVIKVRHRD